MCVLSVPWLVLVHRSFAVSPSPRPPSLLPVEEADPTKGCQTPTLSSLHLPSGWVLRPPVPSQGLGEGSLRVRYQEKAQCTLGAEHSNLSWARCHPEALWEGKANPGVGRLALPHREMLTSLLAIDKVTCSVAGLPLGAQ